jgi:hypothetical protein
VCSHSDAGSDGFPDIRFSDEVKVFQQAWVCDSPVVCNNVSISPFLEDSFKQFKTISSRAVLIQRLSLEGKPVGVAHVNVPRIQQGWGEGLIRLMSDFRTTFLRQLAGISLH